MYQLETAMKNIQKILFFLLVMSIAAAKTSAQVSVGISVRIGPPELPVYVQPPCPVDGYLWQPGYWAYDDGDGYYWVPGVWLAPPDPGVYWTPPYWGYDGGVYLFHTGYWGPHVGFYGGIDYGYGYTGYGFVGGQWSGNRFRYNTAVMRVNRTVVRNTYIDRTVIRNTTVNNRRSFNGPGGVTARPRPQDEVAMRERHIQPTRQQISHQQAASRDRNQHVAVNHGRPVAAAMNKVDGRPFDPRGRVATRSSLGRAGASRSTATPVGRPANTQRPANNSPARQTRERTERPQQGGQQTRSPQPQRMQQREQRQPREQAPQRAQQRQQPQPQQEARPQQQRQEPRPQQQQRPQPQQQQRPQPQQQPHNNPGRPAEPHERHR